MTNAGFLALLHRAALHCGLLLNFDVDNTLGSSNAEKELDESGAEDKPFVLIFSLKPDVTVQDVPDAAEELRDPNKAGV